ncbi:hypothetical protein WS80_01600 [Burkholderia pseudomultivorans]|nr:hypothetical protein WS80_01600 [Burkholderia pseudomultivorans]
MFRVRSERTSTFECKARIFGNLYKVVDSRPLVCLAFQFLAEHHAAHVMKYVIIWLKRYSVVNCFERANMIAFSAQKATKMCVEMCFLREARG